MMFLQRFGITAGPIFEFGSNMLFTNEGERHGRLRRLVSKAFTPRAVELFRPRMRAIAEQLSDRLAERAEDGAVEFVSAFADPYPAWVLCEFMGLSHEEFEPGSWIELSLMSANRDEAAYPDPDRFDIARAAPPVSTFGGGAHYCLGAALSRAELQEAVAVLRAWYPRLELAGTAVWRHVVPSGPGGCQLPGYEARVRQDSITRDVPRTSGSAWLARRC
jgi:cytochrome P450